MQQIQYLAWEVVKVLFLIVLEEGDTFGSRYFPQAVWRQAVYRPNTIVFVPSVRVSHAPIFFI